MGLRKPEINKFKKIIRRFTWILFSSKRIRNAGNKRATRLPP
jgi:hypothetical protein